MNRLKAPPVTRFRVIHGEPEMISDRNISSQQTREKYGKAKGEKMISARAKTEVNAPTKTSPCHFESQLLFTSCIRSSTRFQTLRTCLKYARTGQMRDETYIPTNQALCPVQDNTVQRTHTHGILRLWDVRLLVKLLEQPFLRRLGAVSHLALFLYNDE